MFGSKKFKVRWKLLHRTRGTPTGLSELWPIFKLNNFGNNNLEGDWRQFDPWNKTDFGAHSEKAAQYKSKYDNLWEKAQKEALKKHPEVEGKGHSKWANQTDKMIKQREKEIRKQNPHLTSHEIYQRAYSEIMRKQTDSLVKSRSTKNGLEMEIFKGIAPEIEYEFEGIIMTIPYESKIGPFREPFSHVHSYVFFIYDKNANDGYRRFEVSWKNVNKFLSDNHFTKRDFPFRTPSYEEKKESHRRSAAKEADYRIKEAKKQYKSKRQRMTDDIMRERGWDDE